MPLPLISPTTAVLHPRGQGNYPEINREAVQAVPEAAGLSRAEHRLLIFVCKITAASCLGEAGRSHIWGTLRVDMERRLQIGDCSLARAFC